MDEVLFREREKMCDVNVALVLTKNKQQMCFLF